MSPTRLSLHVSPPRPLAPSPPLFCHPKLIAGLAGHAVSRLHGSYSALFYGVASDALGDLSGGVPAAVDLNALAPGGGDAAAALLRQLERALAAGGCAGCR